MNGLVAVLVLAGAGCSQLASSSASATTPPSQAGTSAAAVSSASPADASLPSASPAAAASASSPADVSTLTASPAVTTSSAATSACATYASGHTFLMLDSAAENADGSLTVTGHTATMICGGPDDSHYATSQATVTGHVVASAKIQVLNATLQLEPMSIAKFPGYLKTDHNVRVFIYVGPRTAITALSEQYHP